MLTRTLSNVTAPRRKAGALAAAIALTLSLLAGSTPAAAASIQPPAQVHAVTLASFRAAPIPRISGTPRVGQVLSATAGAWAPAPTTLTYQWKRAGVTIAGATGTTYRVRPGDAGAALTVTVTAKRASYQPAARQSAGTTQVTGLAYPNCTALSAAYPYGVAKAGVKVNLVSGQAQALKGPPFFSTAVYTLNTKSDRDKDGIACER
ncbi:excalibur calcium-binding domain-containing protein [Cryobacterium sp. SO1]|uniref:excalibur calcium-binding domain-containing protein n=1 Tax=Cryobacterium sp. SO1 TaxID=1897061 RepID=UPI001022F51F|nr:excalibur calcium-binding domain-containing protein [Cryobacterium sp. SO1]RZI37394.1 hypothetical protein BJQ95_00224 [Cryobacterium sp. SO1]